MRPRSSLAFLLLVPLLSCGSTPTSIVHVRIADGVSPNVLHEISASMEAGVDRGIYFEFREMTGCPPASIDSLVDSSGNTVALSYPSTSGPGLNPLQSSFTIDTSGLQMDRFYQVRMVASKIVGPPTYEGIADCPLYLKLENANQIVICFGVAGIVARNCVDAIPYGQCTVPSTCG